MRELLVQPFFLLVIVPMITVFLGVFLKIVSRNDQHTSFRKEDLAFGLEVSITALILLITESVRLASTVTAGSAAVPPGAEDKVVAVPWILLAFVVGIWSVSTLIRKKGWRSETEMNLFWGILLPDFFGIATLLFVVFWIAN